MSLNARLHVQNNHAPKVHQPQLASEVLSILLLCQHRAAGIRSTLQHPSVSYHRGLSNPLAVIRLEINISKHEVSPNQSNLWHQILRHRSVLYSQNWFPLTLSSCRPGTLVSLYTSYCMSIQCITSDIHYKTKYLYNNTGEKQLQIINISNTALKVISYISILMFLNSD